MSLGISPWYEGIAHETIQQEQESGGRVVVSEKVGEIIDVEERNYYGLFMDCENFESAIVLRRPDSTLFAIIITNGGSTTRT